MQNSVGFSPNPFLVAPPPGTAGQAATGPAPAPVPVPAGGAVPLSLIDFRADFIELSQNATDATSYWLAAVRKIAGQSSIVGFAMHGQLAGQSLTDFACVQTIQADAKRKLKSFFHEALIQCECEAQPVLRTDLTLGKATLPVVAIPVRAAAPEELNAAVCFAMKPISPQEVLLPAERLQSLLLQAAMYIPGSTAPTNKTSPQDRTLELIGKSTAYRDTRDFAYELVGSLATRYDCAKASLGLVQNSSVRVLAISGIDQFKASSPGVIDVQQAMAEAADSQSIICDQGLGKTKLARSMPIHKRLGTSSRSAVVSLPLKAGTSVVAVVTLQRDANAPFTDEELEGLNRLLTPFGPALALSIRGDRSFFEHFRQVSQSVLHRLRNPKTQLGWVTRVTAIAALAIFLFGWMPYRPSTPCTVIPGNLNQSIARFDMKLSEALVRSGDMVKAGQVLARFDTRDLNLERARLVANIKQAEVEVRKALTHGDPASAALAKNTSRSLLFQLDAVQSKIDSCTLRAPSDGMVVSADLSTQIGQVFAQGKPILTFAPMDQWELQLKVPERLARFIQNDQTGSFGPTATPGQAHAYRITSVSGSAEVVEGKNVIIAKASLDGAPLDLRHGMTGVASTNTGWRPICWIALHGVYEAFCDLFWL